MYLINTNDQALQVRPAQVTAQYVFEVKNEVHCFNKQNRKADGILSLREKINARFLMNRRTIVATSNKEG